MREPDIEGVATHDVPESCGAAREGGIEALTGVHAGWVLSRETVICSDADAVPEAAGNTTSPLSRGLVGPARSETPSKRGTFLRENREIPWPPVAHEGAAGRNGKAEAVTR
jgi:RNA-directed DNA polymerase